MLINAPYNTYHKLLPLNKASKNLQKKNFDSFKSIEALRRELFTPAKSAITFGWLKHTAPIEEKILDLIKRDDIKNVLVVCHNRADADAIGSNMLICGALESCGKNVISFVPGEYPKQYLYMPSPQTGKAAVDYVSSSDQIKSWLKDNKKFDMAIVTDTSTPYLATDEAVSLIAMADNIAIIDHHNHNAAEQKEEWFNALNKSKFEQTGSELKDDKFLFWNEDRPSASEMVADIDNQIKTEAQEGNFPFYDPLGQKVDPKYRYAGLVGITSDAGGILKPKGMLEAVRLARLANNHIEINGKPQSTTRAYFDWLSVNAGLNIRELDLYSMARLNLPPLAENLCSNLVSGNIDQSVSLANQITEELHKPPYSPEKLTFKHPDLKKSLQFHSLGGIYIKKPSLESPFGVFYMKNNELLKDIAEYTNLKNKDNTNFREINQQDVYHCLKENIEKMIPHNEDTAFFTIATRQGKSVALSLRSFGSKQEETELPVNQHAWGGGLACMAMETLKQEGLISKGGGHADATGGLTVKKIEFFEDILPHIVKTFEAFEHANHNEVS